MSPRYEIVSAPDVAESYGDYGTGQGVVVLDHSARVGYVFTDAATAQAALDNRREYPLSNVYFPSSDAYREATK